MNEYSPEKMGILQPQDRLKALNNYSSTVEIDPSVPPKRYYRSGLEMVRMANVYYEEGSYENAYVLYMKFMTLFLEKIRKHPDYSTVPATERNINQAKLREVLPKAEKLKAQLLEQFTKEYNRYVNELKQRENEEKERHRRESEMLKRVKNISIIPKPSDGWIPPSTMVQPVADLNKIDYPDPNVASTVEPSAPLLPSSTPEPSLPSGSRGSFVPEIDRAKKPSTSSSSTTFSDISLKSGLRTVVTPAKVMTHFLSLAQRSTFNNIETCGILAGKLERDHLIITHVILPKQKGTSDSCTTMNEEEIFEFQDQHNLITIGWIHTHPTQTAFLSSVDLHTHCPYQLLMPEAIAIVCAPKYEQTGFFVLTPNHGLQYIASCRKSGFHPHPTEPPLFMNAEHVRVEENAALEVLDLR